MLQSPASTLRPFAVPPARRFALLWLVIALLVQGFATQTHAHLSVDRSWTVAALTHPATVAVDRQKDIPATPVCPLCEEKALFGAYLLGGSITITTPVDAVYRYAAASLPLLTLRASSHAWRSRAPPTFTA